MLKRHAVIPYNNLLEHSKWLGKTKGFGFIYIS